MVYLILLSGGHGARLWPLSNEDNPKQFIKLCGSISLFQSAIFLNNFHPIIVTNNQYKEIIEKQLIEINIKNFTLILEKKKLGTALSIAIAVSIVNPDDVLLISPSDIVIEDRSAYLDVLQQAFNCSIKNENITSIVVKADNCHLPYGYLRLSKLTDGYHFVQKFIEKPYNLTSHENYCWNTGIFVCHSKTYLSILKNHSCDLFNKLTQLLQIAYYDSYDNLHIPSDDLFEVDDLSVDRVIMEKADNNTAVIGNFTWSDLGSWEMLYNYMISKNCILYVYKDVSYSEKVIQEVIKDKLIIITAESRVFLVFIKLLYKALCKLVIKGWGGYSVLYYYDRVKIKYLVIKANKETSLQKHIHRSENWLIISGTAELFIKDSYRSARTGDLLFVPVNCLHQIKNSDEKRELHIIEIQIGNILSEEDIIRL